MLPARPSAILLIVALTGTARAFPPYRSTDAETAESFVLEARLGLLRLHRSEAANHYSAPLLRLNYGLPGRIELVAEAEFDASEGRLADAAAGVKWVPFLSTVSVGLEALVLLPIDSGGGAGTESQALLTARLPGTLLHINAGGILDARPVETETGWRASALVEAPLEGWRPGLELFTRQLEGDVEALAGAGAIIGLPPIDVRLGAHVGLTDTAPDLVVNLWLASKVRTR